MHGGGTGQRSRRALASSFRKFKSTLQGKEGLMDHKGHPGDRKEPQQQRRLAGSVSGTRDPRSRGRESSPLPRHPVAESRARNSAALLGGGEGEAIARYLGQPGGRQSPIRRQQDRAADGKVQLGHGPPGLRGALSSPEWPRPHLSAPHRAHPPLLSIRKGLSREAWPTHLSPCPPSQQARLQGHSQRHHEAHLGHWVDRPDNHPG